MTKAARAPHVLVGVFVGGRGERLGGVAKGLLTTHAADGREITLIERVLGELRAALPEAEVLLVGNNASYGQLGTLIADSPSGIGPLGGLNALLLEATRRGRSHVLVLACDLPFIRRALIQRLVEEQPQASVLLAETQGVRNPLIARYDAALALAATRSALESAQRSLQAVLDRLLDVRALRLTESEASSLRDWDTPEDIEG